MTLFYKKIAMMSYSRVIIHLEIALLFKKSVLLQRLGIKQKFEENSFFGCQALLLKVAPSIDFIYCLVDIQNRRTNTCEGAIRVD